MKPILTAEEFYKQTTGCVINHGDIKTAMIEFAKHRVEAALKAASEEVKLMKKEIKYTGVRAGGSYFVDIVDKDSILNAYPLENIK